MAAPTIQSGQIKAGPGLIRYAPLGTIIPTFTAAASKVTGTWTNWLEVGATDSGLTYSESVETADITVAESLYPVRTVTTGKAGRVSFTMSHINDLNWKLAMNGGTITSSGAAATKLNVYVPPLVGAEVRVMLAFMSLDEDEVIIWPQVFNVGSVETARGTFDSKAGLPVEFSAELPDPAVMTTPYKRWTSGGLAQGV
ncbi:hypothetical protein M2302_000266 [Micromonospora sp. A200]|uniref:phage tail tube protein n=1 Tax=Micromonospora sp. A200 TaxID=2940568 RepID=UPI002475E4B5|nr:hypothetical protein [Micromonospora sp. A200]MDH6460115.1 hypothetical protein [Micromonospora sp. A200]